MNIMEAPMAVKSVTPIPTVRHHSYCLNTSLETPIPPETIASVRMVELIKAQIVPGDKPEYQKAGDVGNRALWYVETQTSIENEQ